MSHQIGDPGAQFVLDNRKLIVGFALLIILCGTFFVIGFMEGKRQGIQRAKEHLQANPTNTPSAASPAADSVDRPPDRSAKSAPEKSVREQLEWYKSVNKREEAPSSAQAQDPGISEPATDGGSKSSETGASTAKAPPAKKLEPSHPVPAVASQKISYTVQVGAFKHRREAETKAAALKDRGYEYYIEPSGAAEPLFLLKVGRFASRAEAVATQLKLKKDGFATFIKTNQ